MNNKRERERERGGMIALVRVQIACDDGVYAETIISFRMFDVFCSSVQMRERNQAVEADRK